MKIVCLGDSITYGYECFTGNQVVDNYPKLLNDSFSHEFINSGYPGYRVYNILSILQEAVFRHKPDICIIMLGINDAKGSKYGITISCEKYLSYMEKLKTKIEKEGIKIVFLSMTLTTNERVKYFNNRLVKKYNAIDMHYHCEKFINENGLEIEDFIPDGIHLNNKYYKIISNIVEKNWENIC
jgi:lysophospholipase L1-like esterase